MAPTWPVLASRVTIDSTNNVLRFVEDGTTTLDAVIAEGEYYHALSGAVTGSLLRAIIVAMNAVSLSSGASRLYTGLYRAKSAAGGVTGTTELYTDGTSLQLIGSHANTTFDMELLGWPANSDSVAGDPINSTLSSKCTWGSNQPITELFEDPPEADDGETHFTPSGVDYAWLNSEVRGRRTLDLELICEDRVRNNYATTAAGDRYRALYNWWRYARGKPLQLYHEVESSSGVIQLMTALGRLGTYIMPDHLRAPPRMEHEDDRLYRGAIKMREYVA